MILALRQRHRRIIYSLGVLLPMAFVAGLAARHPVPVVDSVPTALAPESPRFDRVVWERADLWPGHDIRTRMLANSNSMAVELSPKTELVKPDLIVYWTPAVVGTASNLPANAVLLGAFAQSQPVALPLLHRAIDGALLLYSLADDEIVATSKPLAAK